VTLAQDIELGGLSTLRLPGRAASFLRLTHPQQFATLAEHPRRFFLGGGSNLVVCGNVDALVVQVALSGKRLINEDDQAWYVEAAAGENWHDFVLWTLAQGWPGLENLALIPGQVGAAPIQNIGAYGLEAGEMIAAVDAYDCERKEMLRFSATDCRFAYRDSLFKQQGWHRSGRILIVSVSFRLPKRWQPRLGYADLARELAARQIKSPSAQQLAEVVIAVRRAKLPDPDILPNAGSFFENPVVSAAEAQALLVQHPQLPHYPQPDGRIKLAAGWLIEHAGWKGRRLGPVGMYEKQALVLVNHGGATGQDVQALVGAVQGDVERQFGVRLRPEPVFVG